jgi:hypothetical protein
MQGKDDGSQPLFVASCGHELIVMNTPTTTHRARFISMKMIANDLRLFIPPKNSQQQAFHFLNYKSLDPVKIEALIFMQLFLVTPA